MEGTIGEIRMWAGARLPRSWAFCEGQLLAIADNTSLYSIIGTEYGGDAHVTFALPDLRGRVPLGAGAGPGLQRRDLGHHGGIEDVTLTKQEMPAHDHTLGASLEPGLSGIPTDAHLASAPIYGSEPTALSPMGRNSISEEGGNSAHTNMQPWLCVKFIICLYGMYPSWG